MPTTTARPLVYTAVAYQRGMRDAVVQTCITALALPPAEREAWMRKQAAKPLLGKIRRTWPAGSTTVS
jgi:hypothetical protein